MPFIQAIERILVSCAKLGTFRKNIDSVRFYLTISALGYYILSNRFTLSAVTGKELMSKDEYDIMKAMHLDVLISYLTSKIGENTVNIPAVPRTLANSLDSKIEAKKPKASASKSKEEIKIEEIKVNLKPELEPAASPKVKEKSVPVDKATKTTKAAKTEKIAKSVKK